MDGISFGGITSLVFAFGCVIALFHIAQNTKEGIKQGILWLFGAALFHMIPKATSLWLTATSSQDTETQWVNAVGSWYGGGFSSTIINSLAEIGMDYGGRIWAAIIAMYLPQLAMLGWAISAYWKHVKGDHLALLIFFLVGSLLVPRIAGGPTADLPKAVLVGARDLMAQIVKDVSGETRAQKGFSLRDVEIARRSAKLPKETRSAAVLMAEMARYHRANSGETGAQDLPVADILTLAGSDEYVNKWVTHRGTNVTLCVGEEKGPDGYIHHPVLDSYHAEVEKGIIWTDDISEMAVINRLTDKQGRLRDVSELPYKTIYLWPMYGAGGDADAKLTAMLKEVYDYTNKRVSGQTKDEIMALINAEQKANPTANSGPVDLAAMEERVKLALEAGQKAVEPPPVVMMKTDLHVVLQNKILAYYQQAAEKFSNFKTNPYTYANDIYDPDFYGVLMFAKNFSLPLNQDDPSRALAEQLTTKSDWTQFMTAPGIKRDLAQGVNNPGAAGFASDTDSWAEILFKAPAWIGLKVVSFFAGVGVPLVKNVVPYVVGIAFLFILAAYPVYAVTALFPGRWTVLIDWAKSVMWVMSWSACYQIGVSWTNGMPVQLTGDGESWSESLSADIFANAGMFLMATAPALTGFVLSASAGALQNIGSAVTGLGFKLAGASWVVGTAIVVAVAGTIAGALSPALGQMVNKAGGMVQKHGLDGVGGDKKGGEGGDKKGGEGGGGKGAGLAGAGGGHGGLMSRFSGVGNALKNGLEGGLQGARMGSGMGAMAVGRWDSFMGTGAGAGANAAGPIDPGERWGKKKQGNSGQGSKDGGDGRDTAEKPTSGLTIASGDGGGGKTANSEVPLPAMGTGSAMAAMQYDRKMAGAPTSSRGLNQAELMHAQSAVFATAGGQHGQAAVSASHAAEAAVLSGSRSAGTRIATAEQAVSGAIASSDSGNNASAHLAGARTQLAKASHLSGVGDTAGAAVATERAAHHMGQATTSSISGLGNAMTSGDTAGRVQHVAVLAGIAEAASASASGSGSMAAVAAQAGSAVRAHGSTSGAPAAAAQGFTALLSGDSHGAEGHFRAAATQSQGTVVQQVMLSAATASFGGDASASDVAQTVVTTMAPTQSLAVHPYARPAPTK